MSIPVNLPFDRVPQCACDPGTGPAPRNAEIFALRAELERLRLWIRRIDNINDDPAYFNKEIDQACVDALAGKPMTGKITVQQKEDHARSCDLLNGGIKCSCKV